MQGFIRQVRCPLRLRSYGCAHCLISTTFCAGLIPALIQGPLSRFGDTAANDGVQAALASMEVRVLRPKIWGTQIPTLNLGVCIQYIHIPWRCVFRDLGLRFGEPYTLN